MATPSAIHLTPNDTGVVRFEQPTKESAEMASMLLQKNHDEHDIFFNTSGFHNHIVHHILSLYGLGAPASVLEKQYKQNAAYQMKPKPVNEENVKAMRDPEQFKKFLGKRKHVHDFIVFFQREMEVEGLKAVLQEYLFSRTEIADDMLVRMFAGFLHPIIHLGFGLEYNQPAIVCEALGEAAVHDSWIGDFLIPAEKAAEAYTGPPKTLPQLLKEIRDNKKLSTSAEWNDDNKIRDGVMARAGEEAIKIASQWKVTEPELQAKTVEMYNTVVYYTAAAQHPPKQVKFDFYFMHCVNSSIFWTTFNALPWLSIESKIRLLEWKGRMDLAMYASRRSPALLMEEIVQYTPKGVEAGSMEWKGLFRRLYEKPEDGHAIKLARAVAHGEQISQHFEKEDWCTIRGFQWEKIGNMVVDSVEDTGSTWVRSAGFDEAWEEYEDRPRRNRL